MLLYPSGLEFIEAFLGCLAAGVIAVPAYPPRKNRSVERLLAIADDCSPCLILTTREVAPKLIPEIVNGYVVRKCLCTEMETSRDKGNFAERSGSTTGLNRWLDHLRPEQSAFLQYTSGSTRRPRGVVVTHRNLMHNERVIQASFGSSARTVAVSWLPLFHDMGLIGGVLHPLYLGCEAILLAPTAFLAEPVSWLCPVTEFRGTISGGPNFGWEHCLRKVSEAEKSELDLSSLEVASVGAAWSSPRHWTALRLPFPVAVSSGVLFSPATDWPSRHCLFREARRDASFLGFKFPLPPLNSIVGFPRTMCNMRILVWLVSCGRIAAETQVVIVNPESCQRCGHGGDW